MVHMVYCTPIPRLRQFFAVESRLQHTVSRKVVPGLKTLNSVLKTSSSPYLNVRGKEAKIRARNETSTDKFHLNVNV